MYDVFTNRAKDCFGFWTETNDCKISRRTCGEETIFITITVKIVAK